MTKRQNIIGLISLGIIILLIAGVFCPYVRAEILTRVYGEEFIGLESQTNMLNESKYLKVLDYSYNKAKVFYISDTGDVITFIKDKNGDWVLGHWETVWSKYGSADGFYWPYYR